MTAEDQSREPTTDDAVLGGALVIRQPARGYRAGLDAVLLAAAVPLAIDRPADVVDLGAGVGTVGLAIALRGGLIRATLVERDPALADLARGNVARNGLEPRVRVILADVAAPALDLAAAGLAPDSIDHAVANPPYFTEGCGIRATLEQRATSRAMPEAGLEAWIKTAARAVRPGGTLTLIYRPEALGRLLPALEGRFGGVLIKPLAATPDAPATRILVHGRKGSRAPLRLLAPLVTHTQGDHYTDEVKALIVASVGARWFG